MANFAKIGLNNIVLDVQLIDNISAMTPQGVESEEVACAFLAKMFGHQTWLKTSFNTRGGVHILGGTPLRKNYAGIGYTFDGVGFAAPQPFASWTKNTETYIWEAPTPMPTDDKRYTWDEATLAWIEVVTE
jgi:hypothetical protein